MVQMKPLGTHLENAPNVIALPRLSDPKGKCPDQQVSACLRRQRGETVDVRHVFNMKLSYYLAHAVSERDKVFRRTGRIHRSWRSAAIPAPIPNHLPVRVDFLRLGLLPANTSLVAAVVQFEITDSAKSTPHPHPASCLIFLNRAYRLT